MKKNAVVDKKKVKEKIEKKEVIHFFKNGLFIFFIILLLMVLYSKYIKQNPIIKVFGNAFLIVATGSMEPEIVSGELIVIREMQNYEKGDVVTYIDKDGFMITHRIVEKSIGTFVSKGDANNIEDEPCEINKIQGKVIFHSKVFGFFVLYLLKPICMLYAISIVIIEILKQKKKGESKHESGDKQTTKI